MQFEGIYTPIVTPYNSDFSINRDRFADAVERDELFRPSKSPDALKSALTRLP